jgi:Ca2+-binding RTX toxin-like protein
VLIGWDGSDTLFGGHGRDELYGYKGDDVLYSIEVDGLPDVINCGENPNANSDFDRAVVRKEDTVKNCEWVRILRLA